jgi:quercetin dioxygenase-like cupin family protein
MRPSRGPLFPLLAVVGLTVGTTWWYLPHVKQAWWDLKYIAATYSRTHSGGEWHGGNVFRTVPGDTPYDRWLDKSRGHLPMFEGVVIPDISTVALGPWPEMGDNISGLYLRFADYQISDGRILEIPAGAWMAPQQHLFEMGVYFLGGPGHTLLFHEGGEPERLDWQAGSVFSVPLNTRYQHFNDGDRPVRILAVTSFPFALNATNSESFIFDNQHRFTERFAGGTEFFQLSEAVGERRTRTNFVPDAMQVELVPGSNRGVGQRTMSWPMAGNTVLDLHVSSIEPRSHMKAHRHSSDAFLLMLSGAGYTLIWTGDDVANRQRIDWQRYTLLVPPTYWYHQHFNASGGESRHLAINAPELVLNLGLRFYDQIERDSPEISAEWAREIRGNRPP